MTTGNAIDGAAMRRGLARIAATLALALYVVPGLASEVDGLAAIVRAAAGGSDASQVLLAVAYLNGGGRLMRDSAKAAFWFEQAAIQGNAYAERMLGDLYEQGRGVPANQKLAFDWRIKAARRGELDAQLAVGKMYQGGIGVSRDVDRALYWYRRAALAGSAEAQSLTEQLQRYGRDAEVTQASSRSSFEMAAKRAYELARSFVDVVEEFGYRVAEDWHQRLPELEQPARDGDLEAAYQLGRRYERGVGGVKQDQATSLAWYRRAAEGGHPMAALALAGIRASGVDSGIKSPDGANRPSSR